MSIKKTIGGDRLGAGGKMVEYLHNYERSNHNLSYAWRSTIAPGVLIPCLNLKMTPGDTFDIDIDTMMMTLPTIGPLFGNYKQQIDVFITPMRLYQAQIHNNKTGIGRDMSKIKMPLMNITMNDLNFLSSEPADVQQIGTSSLLKYLGFSGLGYAETPNEDQTVSGSIQALDVLNYYDIGKNYYANLQEEQMAMIDYPNIDVTAITSVSKNGATTTLPTTITTGDVIGIQGIGLEAKLINILYGVGIETTLDLWTTVKITVQTDTYIEFQCLPVGNAISLTDVSVVPNAIQTPTPNVVFFPIENIDNMREDILSRIKDTTPFIIDATTYAPYGNNLQSMGNTSGNKIRSYMPMQGLLCKTYQSDLFNNWMNKEWIDGEGGASDLSNIDVSEGVLNMDTLNLAQKVYNFMNRVIMAGGSYYNWIEAGWGVKVAGHCETPMYCGGASREITFAQQISTAETADKPQGNIAGRGIYEGNQKGGKITVRCMDNEPCMVMAIVSLTPRLDYSQGNDWSIHLKTWQDLHKPEFDGIGYQDLVTDKMAFWDTARDEDGIPKFKSAGKQPAWIDYMTAVNKCYGDFADSRNEMFMTLNRRYEYGSKRGDGITDLTTYIDPAKYNYIFANTKRNAQNFWCQIGFGIKARRKLSARQMPNL